MDEKLGRIEEFPNRKVDRAMAESVSARVTTLERWEYEALMPWIRPRLQANIRYAVESTRGGAHAGAEYVARQIAAFRALKKRPVGVTKGPLSLSPVDLPNRQALPGNRGSKAVQPGQLHYSGSHLRWIRYTPGRQAF